MADSIAEVIGMATLLMSLDAFAIATTLEVREAVQASAQKALDQAIVLCPVSPDGSHGNPPGFLRDGNAIRPVVELALLEQWELYNDVPYCGFVVLGTYKMAAQDFMTPAFEAGRADLEERIALIASF